jgi:hypothetical protein
MNQFIKTDLIFFFDSNDIIMVTSYLQHGTKKPFNEQWKRVKNIIMHFSKSVLYIIKNDI